MKTVILDTNFLLLQGRFKIDIFAQIVDLIEEKVEFLTFDSVVKEIKEISKIKGKNGVFARLALKLLKLRNVKILKGSKGDADEDIICYCKINRDVIVATNDVELRKKLKEIGIKTIFLRGKKKLDLI